MAVETFDQQEISLCLLFFFSVAVLLVLEQVDLTWKKSISHLRLNRSLITDVVGWAGSSHPEQGYM